MSNGACGSSVRPRPSSNSRSAWHAGGGEPGRQVLRQQAALEDLVAGRHGRMDRECRAVGRPRAARPPGRVPGCASIELARALEQQERGVALVEVPHGGVDADGAQGADAAHAEHDLLAEPHLAAADVEDVGDRPVRRIVVRHVGVEQEERHAAHLGDPHGGVDVAAGEVDLDLQRQPVAAAGAPQRQLVRIDIGLGVLLVAVRVDLLPEVAAPIEEAHPHERQRRIGGGLAGGRRRGRRGRRSRSASTRGCRTRRRSRRPARGAGDRARVRYQLSAPL